MNATDDTTTPVLAPPGGAHVTPKRSTRDGGGPRLAALTGAAPPLAAVGRRAAALAVAGALTCLALAPTTAHASQRPAEGGDGAYWYFRYVDRGIDDDVAARKTQAARDYVELAAARSQFTSQRRLQGTARARTVVGGSRADPAVVVTCYIPETLDEWSRRLIAVQFCT